MDWVKKNAKLVAIIAIVVVVLLLVVAVIVGVKEALAAAGLLGTGIALRVVTAKEREAKESGQTAAKNTDQVVEELEAKKKELQDRKEEIKEEVEDMNDEEKSKLGGKLLGKD
jgi:uncharacterized membrane protein (DUF106 family)